MSQILQLPYFFLQQKLEGELGEGSVSKQKFDAVSKELGKTKDTLTKTLSQLADKSTAISEKDRRVADATKQLEACLPYCIRVTPPTALANKFLLNLATQLGETQSFSPASYVAPKETFILCNEPVFVISIWQQYYKWLHGGSGILTGCMQAARLERDEAKGKLSELEASSQKAVQNQKEIEAERKRGAKLQVSSPLL